MFDVEIAQDSLQKIKAMLEIITERFSVVQSPNDFLCSPGGMLRLDAICMNLIALGETVKGLDNKTNHELQYQRQSLNLKKGLLRFMLILLVFSPKLTKNRFCASLTQEFAGDSEKRQGFFVPTL